MGTCSGSISRRALHDHVKRRFQVNDENPTKSNPRFHHCRVRDPGSLPEGAVLSQNGGAPGKPASLPGLRPTPDSRRSRARPMGRRPTRARTPRSGSSSTSQQDELRREWFPAPREHSSPTRPAPTPRSGSISRARRRWTTSSPTSRPSSAATTPRSRRRFSPWTRRPTERHGR